MSEQINLKLKKIPGTFSNYAKLVFVRRKGLKKGENLPDISSEVRGIKLNLKKIKKYNKACGIEDSDFMPVLYPHVLASSVYMKVLTHKKFPFHLMGSLHLRNHIIQHRQVGLDEILDLEVKISDQRIVKQGIEFDFTISLNTNEEIVWESISTWLTKGKFGTEFDESPNADLFNPIPEAKHHIDLYIPKNIGKKFAGITGDYNPIHISRVLAPLFGLKRDIAHAMWASGNAIANLPEISNESPVRIDLAFKGPLFLDNRSSLKIEEYEKGYRFDLHCGDNPRPSIAGSVNSVPTGESLLNKNE